LGEAEKWNSSFKLVVAYAQKPGDVLGGSAKGVMGRKRGNSV